MEMDECGCLRSSDQGEGIMKRLKNTDVEVITARLQQIELENKRLKELVEDFPSYKQILQQLLKKRH